MVFVLCAKIHAELTVHVINGELNYMRGLRKKCLGVTKEIKAEKFKC